jgi:hypothetical protein
MCGGDLNIQEGNPICECEFCGTQQTVPQLDDEKKANQFNRANKLRMSADFDKAATVYASITAEYPEEAEAYWGLCLCKYGIEYVDDPASGKKVPTCHRTLTDSIMDDNDFDQACENADPIAMRLYREEAKEIDRLQQSILNIVANEAPYDVFICYKETDEEGNRTEDSVIAQEIYDALTEKGLKVFFSRITLEDKLGQQYEPYIYAALYSSRVMLAVGTKFEYYNAAWVKNEWARFLSMMKTEKGKTLIPCYKDLDAYDMPKEFKNLQGQDMTKLGWLQDLIRGVMKLCGKEEKKDLAGQQTSTINIANPQLESLLKRAFVFLEDEDWGSAREYANKALDIDVEDGRAYLIILMSQLGVQKEGDLANLTESFINNENYSKILRYGDPSLKGRLENYLNAIEYRRKKSLLEDSRKRIEAAVSVEACEKIKNALVDIRGFEDADTLINNCDLAIQNLQDAKQLLADTEKKVLSLEREFYSKKNAYDRNLENISKGDSKLDSLRDRYESNKKTMEQLQLELQEVHGIFSGGRKKQLEESIAKCHRRDTELEKDIESTELEIQKLKNNTFEVPDANELQYQIANEYYKAGVYLKAYFKYDEIGQYKDADKFLSTDPKMIAVSEYAKRLKPFITVGATVSFGHDHNGTLSWLVLDVRDNKSLLISNRAFIKEKYNTGRGNIMTWEKCGLRRYLNSNFLSSYHFSQDEMDAILLTNVNNGSNQGNPDYKTTGGNNTQDKVFVLSYAEVQKYFSNRSNKYSCNKSSISPYSEVAWWTRSPGETNDRVCVVGRTIYKKDADTNDNEVVPRPAFWIDISKLMTLL